MALRCPWQGLLVRVPKGTVDSDMPVRAQKYRTLRCGINFFLRNVLNAVTLLKQSMQIHLVSYLMR